MSTNAEPEVEPRGERVEKAPLNVDELQTVIGGDGTTLPPQENESENMATLAT